MRVCFIALLQLHEAQMVKDKKSKKSKKSKSKKEKKEKKHKKSSQVRFKVLCSVSKAHRVDLLMGYAF